MSSLCHRPKLISSLQTILCVAHVVSYGRKHQVRVENKQMTSISPRDRLATRSDCNVWNLAVIDNIDFRGKTFAYENIFDAVRKSSHATLRMVFQFEEPISDDSVILLPPVEQELPLGLNSTTDMWDEALPKIISTLLLLEGREFHVEDINKRMKQHIPLGCRNVGPPKVVILEAGEAPSSNTNVHKACERLWKRCA